MAGKILVFFLLLATCSFLSSARSYNGEWKLLEKSIGISAMHMALLPSDRIIAFDRTDMGPSNITLSDGRCLKVSKTIDCYAHSVEFNPAVGSVRPLTIFTDTWCSSGALLADGVLVQSGGYGDGDRVVRRESLRFRKRPCNSSRLCERQGYSKLSGFAGGFSRNYPSTGSSALLPLKLLNGRTPDAEVVVCGGTLPNSNVKANAGVFLPAAKTCGRLVITAANPEWEMEEMPLNRVMGDMIMLPTGHVLIINGAAKGTAGWEVATEPVLNPVLYSPEKPRISRFEVLSASKIPRLYHSSAQLLSDGRVLVGGSNPHRNYNFTTLYPTDLSLEAFYPPYLTSGKSRPSISWVKPGAELVYNQRVSLGFYSMEKMSPRRCTLCSGHCLGGTARYYLLFVVHGGVPSNGTWVHIK
ncbi:hypothetical protein SLA2020_438920 [Shorea laevis]